MRLPSYTVQKIEPLSGCNRIFATALNNRGQVVGYGYTYRSRPQTRQAFFWDRDQTVALPAGATGSQAWGLNDRGDVVGWATQERRTGLAQEDIGFVSWPVLWVGIAADESNSGGVPDPRALRLATEGGPPLAINIHRQIVGEADSLRRPTAARRMQRQRLPVPLKGHSLTVQAINNRGQMVAYCTPLEDLAPEQPTRYRGFWRPAGTWLRLSTPGLTASARSAPCALNEAGLVVGWASASARSPHFPWVWRSGKGQPLSARPGEALSVNAAGRIVGSSSESRMPPFACLWQDGQPVDLNGLVDGEPGLARAVGINNQGQILVNTHDLTVAYLLTPT